MARSIPLIGVKKVALVDDEDYEALASGSRRDEARRGVSRGTTFAYRMVGE